MRPVASAFYEVLARYEWSHEHPTVEVAKIGKEALSSLLAPAKDIIAILDIVAQIHPAVSVCHFRVL